MFPEIFAREQEVGIGLPEQIREIVPPKDRLDRATSFLREAGKYSLREEDAVNLVAGGNVLHGVRLQNLLSEFEVMLTQDLPGSDWQAFFAKNMLTLNPGYIKAIPKANIAPVTGELPDFLLISVEGYVDVYEVKLPGTVLLNYDGGRHNYYWSSDIAKAISQTENYISTLSSNKYVLERNIQEKYKIKLTILRPREYVIAGKSSQLQDTQECDYFRLLKESLRNTRIVPYDALRHG